ncbi:MAG: hypothetical protein FJ086_05670 [Deltaproteobacteria bacterium]|nr:hypothetical protein [Deltaproteobacteria bacterium]
MPRTTLTLASAVLLFTATACGPNLCEKADAAAAGKAGTCSSALPSLGSGCAAALSACSEADRKQLEAWVACVGALPTCAPLGESDWVAARDACYAPLASLGATCKDGLFGSALPGTPDGGPAPVTRSPDTDGRGALDLVVAADESNMALAWTAAQPGQVAGWEVHSVDGSGASVPMEAVSAPDARTFSVTGLSAGTLRSYWVVGVDAQGNVAFGRPPQAAGATDAGSGCKGPAECPETQVCDLGTCRVLSCRGGTGSCPGGYGCSATTATCVRQPGAGAGVPTSSDAGTPAQGEQARPFISERRSATTGDAGYAERVVSDFAADQDPALAALDSARQAMVLQQGGQLFSHATADRGARWTVSLLDAIGQRAHLAWNRESGALFACYQVGTFVRVRVSSTGGMGWDPGAVDVSYPAPGDGSPAPVVKDCDIAPWTEGRALLVTAEPDGLYVRTVGRDLSLSDKQPAYANESPAGGVSTVFAAERPSIDTDPAKSIVHVVFTGSRNLLAGGTDKDVYGVYRDPAKTGAQFSSRKRLTLGSLGSQGQNLVQDHAQVAVQPGTGRAVAVFQSEEPGASGTAPFQSVYVAMFGLNAQLPDWASGSDLSVFVKDNVGNFLVLPDRPAVGSAWDAVSPAVAVLPSGQITVAFSAGAQGQPSLPYAVGFSFEAVSQVGTAAGKGWFVPPAVKVAGAAVVDFGNSPRLAGPVLAADGQLSTYLGYIEGVGSGASLPNRLLLYARP